uniref:Uncharacterized protein n=1 Tax=Arundo donax TaxID=35708 RepID=A0A0A8XZ14_ARUDO
MKMLMDFILSTLRVHGHKLI